MHERVRSGQIQVFGASAQEAKGPSARGVGFCISRRVRWLGGWLGLVLVLSEGELAKVNDLRQRRDHPFLVNARSAILAF